MNIKIGDKVVFVHRFINRVQVVTRVRDNWEVFLEEMNNSNGSWWVHSTVEKITKEEFPEYFI